MASERRSGTVNEHEICDVEFVDEARVNIVRDAMIETERLDSLAGVFKTLGDPTRLRIVAALGVGELCVCDLANLLGMGISAVSHQLRLLRISKIVKHRKEGKMVYYSLDDECVEHLLSEGIKHIVEH